MQTTSIVRNTLNPMWDASHDTFVFPVSNFDSAMGDVVKLSLWDSVSVCTVSPIAIAEAAFLVTQDKTGADNLLGVAIIPVFQLRPMPLSTVAHTTAPAVASPLSSTNGSSPTDEAAFAALMQAQAVLAPVTFQLRSPSVSLQSVLDPDAAPGDLYCGEVMVRAQFLLSTASMARHAAKVPIAPQLVAAKYGAYVVVKNVRLFCHLTFAAFIIQAQTCIHPRIFSDSLAVTT